MIADEDLRAESLEEGENYFISMTDMMVGVLFIFIIMLMVFALDFRRTTTSQEDIAREVARKLEELRSEVRGEISALNDAEQARRRLLRDIEAELLAEGLSVQVDEANGVLRLTENAVRFSRNRADLVGNARTNVGKIAIVLDRVLPRYTACSFVVSKLDCPEGKSSTIETVFVEGHTDVTGVPDPIARDQRNWQLSTERAVNTYREIITIAPELRNLRNRNGEELVSVSGYSSTRPIDARNEEDAWTKNRRIDLRFIMEVDSRQRLKQILDLTDDMKEQIDRLAKASDGGS